MSVHEDPVSRPHTCRPTIHLSNKEVERCRHPDLCEVLLARPKQDIKPRVSPNVKTRTNFGIKRPARPTAISPISADITYYEDSRRQSASFTPNDGPWQVSEDLRDQNELTRNFTLFPLATKPCEIPGLGGKQESPTRILSE